MTEPNAPRRTRRLAELRQARIDRLSETYASGAPVEMRVEPGYVARVNLNVEHLFATMEEALAWAEENAPSHFLAQITGQEESGFSINSAAASVEFRRPGQLEPPW